MVTRTVASVNAKVLCCDITTAETTVQEFQLATDIIDKDVLLKMLKKHYETDTLKLVVVSEATLNEDLYGMLETDFLKYASKLDKDTRKMIEE